MLYKDEEFLIWLSSIAGISLKKKYVLLKHFGSAKNLFYAKAIEIQRFCQAYKINFRSIIDIKEEYVLQKLIDNLYKSNISFISKDNPEFPNLLKSIQDPPLGLYVLGKIPQNKFKVSVIGSRQCTQYGANNAYRFSKELAERGIDVVSGMALGIDSMAHKGAIDGKGKTIAILGCGVDVIYPSSNRAIRENIIQNGCIISEFPPKTQAFPANFPIRNRIISGISDAVVVVEAAKRSGTLITVGQALDQGREVFAVPGSINNPLSEGTNNLLKECAYPLTTIDDITQNLGILDKFYEEKLNKNQSKATNNFQKQDAEYAEKEKLILQSLTKEESIVYQCITNIPITVDELVFKSKLNIKDVQFILTMLELKSCIKRLAGQKYIKNI